MANKWMQRLAKHDTARQWDYDPFNVKNILRFSSPSMNFIFGNTEGLPKGFPCIIYGPEKSGKTIFCYDLIAETQRCDPKALVVRYDTEMRDEAQLTPQQAAAYGIDIDRYMPYIGNNPAKIFDHIENEIDAMCQEGAPIKLVIIDSLTNIKGRKMSAAESITKNTIGDESSTQQTGLKRIWEVIHKHRLGFVLTCQVRAEFDEFEKMRNGVDYKMAGGWYLKHFGGYVIHVAPNKGKTGKENLSGEKFENEALKDGLGHAEKTGHKIRIKMVGNSYGPKGRSAEVTFDYKKGFINHHEEAFMLGTERGIVQRPNNTTYVMKDYPSKGEEKSWRGKDAFIKAIADDSTLYEEIVNRLRQQDEDLMKNGMNSAYYKVEETQETEEAQEMFEAAEGT